MSETATPSRGIGGHQRGHRGSTDDWLTPPEIIDALGPFDLDPCCPIGMPWETATTMWTPDDDGRIREWFGRVWLNPPYGPETDYWLGRIATHGNGIALIFARTETAMFHRYGWESATAMFFFRGRLHFHTPDGKRAPANAGGPSVLIAYGNDCAERIRNLNMPGKFIDLRAQA